MKQLLLVFCLAALCMAQGKVKAQIWDGKADSEWYWENPEKTEFTIATAAQLAGLAQLVNGGNNFSGKTIKLGASIMLNDTANWSGWEKTKPANAWTPIGSFEDKNNNRPFSGTFDGDSNVISGVYINSSSNYQGLFGYIGSGATLKNLGVAASYIKGGGYESFTGGLVAWNGGTITDCYFKGDVIGISSSYSGNESSVGGLAGGNSGAITNSYATGSVDGGTIGGLVGRNKGGTITNSYATGNVWGNEDAGGLVGNNEEGGTITNSYATGNVKGKFAGGLVGENKGGTITNSYATGEVSSERSAGGLVGYNTEGTITNSYATGNVKRNGNMGGSITGGLVASNKDGIIESSYATGNVSGSEYAGGLVGNNNGGTITNCHAIGNVGNYEHNYSSGGLAGANSGTITNSYATGNVWGNKDAGGLVGINYEKCTNSYAMGSVYGETTGGLVGENNRGTITNSYAMGGVEGKTAGGLVGEAKGTPADNFLKAPEKRSVIENSYATGVVKGTSSTIGGLIGVNGLSTITNSYYDRQASGQSDIVKGEPKSTAQMKQQAIFSSWNFDSTWKIDESKNNGYPYLQYSEKNFPVKFKYNGIEQGEVLTDKRDSKKYKTVIINKQTWMAENLNYNAKGSKCYDEGSKRYDSKSKKYITLTVASAEIQANCAKYGRLYDWNTATKACPSGWHLPTRKEWDELDSHVDMYLSNEAGKYLKATNGWTDNKNGTDYFGFSALPGGGGNLIDNSYYFVSLVGYGGDWWSISELNSNYAYYRHMRYDSERTGWDNDGKSSLFSVRCIKD